ncbi:hypothetical protein Vretimale_4313 [Volvox reticuliferus]|uniref:Uncharacterized protein n=1 Tax=Volvox reticuliferus TaxID=1737510 RepID=A0A8J4DAY9_9CHLO|nr:hypothetical protein Vretimale_4313 [Volvox reticuliferus]
MFFDELRRDAGSKQMVLVEQSIRLDGLQKNFPRIYLLVPGGYGHTTASMLAARHPRVQIVSFSDAHHAVETAVRLVMSLSEDGCEDGDRHGCNDMPAQEYSV